MDTAWSWGTFVAATIAYWLVVISGWVAWSRRSAKRKRPDVVRQISENMVYVAFTDEINLLPVGAVLLGPPLVGLILLLVG